LRSLGTSPTLRAGRRVTALPAGTVDSLLKPENKAQLDKILTYHVVAGRFDAPSLERQIKAGGGKTTL
jgi:uncharacterized surface protein with fasciclin (FAS1) repeats